VQTASRAPFVSLFSGDSTGGRDRGIEGFLEAKPTKTHKDVRSTGGNKFYPFVEVLRVDTSIICLNKREYGVF